MSGFAYAVRRGVAQRVAIKAALDQKGELVWVHLTTSDDHAKAWLTGAGLSSYATEALTAAETRPRCDAVGDGAVVNLRGLSSETRPGADALASIRIFARAGQVFTVTRRELDAIEPVCKQVEAGEILDPGDLIAAIALQITEELDPMVADLGDSLDDCEESIAAAGAFERRRSVNRVRASAIAYRRFLTPQRAAIEKLALIPGDWLSDDDRLHLSAAADRAARMAEELDAIRERAALTHETLTDLRAEQIDQRSLLIAVAAMVFLPLTFITGLLGMNVPIPYAHEPWAFDAVLALCAVIGLVVAGWFVHRHWFRGS